MWIHSSPHLGVLLCGPKAGLWKKTTLWYTVWNGSSEVKVFLNSPTVTQFDLFEKWINELFWEKTLSRIFFLSKRIGSKLCPSGFPSFRLTLSKLSLPLKMGEPEALAVRARANGGLCLLPCLLPGPPLSPLLPSAWPSQVCTAFRGFADSLLILHSCQLIPSPRTTIISGTYWCSSIYHSLCWIFPQYGLSDLVVDISPSDLWVPLGKVPRCQRNGILYISSSQCVVHIRWGSPETPWEVKAVFVIIPRGSLASALLTFALYGCKSMVRKTAGSSAWIKWHQAIFLGTVPFTITQW